MSVYEIQGEELLFDDIFTVILSKLKKCFKSRKNDECCIYYTNHIFEREITIYFSREEFENDEELHGLIKRKIIAAILNQEDINSVSFEELKILLELKIPIDILEYIVPIIIHDNFNSSRLDEDEDEDEVMDTLKLIIKYGLDPNFVFDNNSLLFMVCYRFTDIYDIRPFEYLIENGADPNYQDKNGDTVLMFLIKDNDYFIKYSGYETGFIFFKKLINILIKHTDLSLINKDGHDYYDLIIRSARK